MDDRIEPADAALALSEIGRRREQAIRRAVRAAFPVWYWWTNAVLIIALAVAVDYGRGVVLWLGIALFTVGQLISSVLVSRAARAAPPRRGLDVPGSVRGTLAGVAAFMAVLMGVTLATGLSLKAARVPHPGTIAATVAAVLFAVGGQLLIRYATAVMVRRAGSRQ
jgi:hypothetical protein